MKKPPREKPRPAPEARPGPRINRRIRNRPLRTPPPILIPRDAGVERFRVRCPYCRGMLNLEQC